MSAVRSATGQPSLTERVGALFERRPDALGSPYEIYRRMRAEQPVMAFGPLVVVSRHSDVVSTLHDTNTFSSQHFAGSAIEARKAELDWAGVSQLETFLSNQRTWIIHKDGPDHRRLRGLANQAFARGRVNELRDTIQRLTDELLDEAERNGPEVDLVETLSYKLPLRVIMALLGAPADRAAEIRSWSIQIGIAVGTTYADVDAAYNAIEAFRAYVIEHVEQCRHRDRENLVTALLTAEEDDTRLSTEELVGLLVVLFVAGHETTTNLISNGAVALLQHPDQAAQLRANPGLMPNAVEEILRYCTSVHAIHRVAVKNTELQGVSITKGQTVRLLLASANHDEEVFADPEVFDVHRVNASKHLAFAHGMHRCLGAWLARMEIQIALASLLQRFPALTMAERGYEQAANFGFYGPKRLTLKLW